MIKSFLLIGISSFQKNSPGRRPHSSTYLAMIQRLREEGMKRKQEKKNERRRKTPLRFEVVPRRHRRQVDVDQDDNAPASLESDGRNAVGVSKYPLPSSLTGGFFIEESGDYYDSGSSSIGDIGSI